MNKKTLIVIFFSIMFLLIAHTSMAITIDLIDGILYAETGTTLPQPEGDPDMWFSSGWDASGTAISAAVYDSTAGQYVNGFASAQKVNGPSGVNHARFILTTTAESSNGNSGVAFETYGLARSGLNPGDMLTMRLTPELGEEGMGVELSAEAVLAGSLISSGLPMFPFLLECGIASVDFHFSIYKDPTDLPIWSFSYSNSVQNDTLNVSKSLPMPGNLGSWVDTTSFMAGDLIYLDFEQVVHAIVTEDMQCSAQAFGIHSETDVISVAIEADPYEKPDPSPVPEPASFLLLGIGILGCGLFGKRKKISS